METVNIRDRQSVLDLTLQVTGSMEAAIRFAVQNGLSLSDDLSDGDGVETVTEEDQTVTKRYAVYGVLPATALGDDDYALLQEGINYMGIEIDFVVS